MMVDNEYTKLGAKLRVFAILTLVVGLLSLVERVLPISISGLVAIPLLVFQIMVIIGAKKSAKAYNKADLNVFGTMMIVSLIFSFVSVGVIFAMSFVAVFAELMGGGSGIISLLPILVTGEIVSLITITFETVAWFSMLKFFSSLDEIDVRSRGTPGAILAIVGSLVSVASSLIINIPSMFNNPTIDLYDLEIIISPGQEAASALFSIGTLVVYVIGYFIMCNAFIQLGNLRPPSQAYLPPGVTTSWDGRNAAGSPPPGAWDGRATPAGPGPTTPPAADPGRCPACGSSLVSTDPRALFCGECGARLPGRG